MEGRGSEEKIKEVEERGGEERKEEKIKDLDKIRDFFLPRPLPQTSFVSLSVSLDPSRLSVGGHGKPEGTSIRGLSLETPSAGLVMDHSSLAPKTTP